ncbi:GNAT family N-acetyltransferase [Pedobacter nyackensis]|uniref:Acetyltransferase (GNAT) domain-containing protein n=1 Tax=Pedobacter nyackensis TaxID=475255 RepID=A0A1W2DCL3_9SPHI|nr:GNAT family N-acetyltransferase [Pedobacter nyackensis]SMC95200.1 Acetyltransferase (GNAT) domain-containing protein [Pedobacter nyackensis]
MTYRLITIQQKKEWMRYVAESLNHDFYHTWHYHSLVDNGDPFLFVYQEDNIFIALPLLKRRIENSDLFDLTSAYGYTGPISNLDFDSMSDPIIDNFRASFLSFMHEGQNVCVFSRLNPFINQKRLLERIGGIYENGQTVYIDLTEPIEVQRSKYEKRLARKIRALRTKNFKIKEADSPEDIRAFTVMYTENMLRNGASERYLYNEDYFSQLLRAPDSNCKLVMVYDNDQAICGNIVMFAGSIIRNHLSATATSHVHESPSKLIIDEISLLGRALGISYYHLGGGLGGRSDSLFQFKAAFSNLILEDRTWRFVADTASYEELVNTRAVNKSAGFFPVYRSTF